MWLLRAICTRINYFLLLLLVVFEPIPTIYFSLTLNVSAINLLLSNAASQLVIRSSLYSVLRITFI